MHFNIKESVVWPISLDFPTEQLADVAMLLATLLALLANVWRCLCAGVRSKTGNIAWQHCVSY